MKNLNKDVLTVLQKTKELIRSPRNWTQFAAARDSDSHPVGYNSKRAVRWHIVAAILRSIDWSNVSALHIHDKTYDILKEIYTQHGFVYDLTGINDDVNRKQAFNNIHGILNHAINRVKKNIELPIVNKHRL